MEKMTANQLDNLVALIVDDYRVRNDRNRLSTLCKVLRQLAASPRDCATRNCAGRLAGRLNRACKIVRPEIDLPDASVDLLELRNRLLIASL